MRYLILVGAISFFALGCTRSETFRQYVTEDYYFDINTIKYSLNAGVITLEFDKENEFQNWFMDISIQDYKGNSYGLTGVFNFSNDKTEIEFPDLPKTYTLDSITRFDILANQQKCHLFKNGQPVQKPFYHISQPGILTIHQDISKTNLVRIESDAWNLEGDELKQFSEYLDSLLNI